jgi:hypothetical protein
VDSRFDQTGNSRVVLRGFSKYKSENERDLDQKLLKFYYK